MKNIKKVAFASTAALLLTSSLVSAQTTIGGNMRIGLKASSAPGKAASDTNMTKETQINVGSTGNLNFGGGKYAAGFAIEYDGNEAAFDAVQNFENNHINFIFGNTTLHAGADHLKPTNVNLAEIVGGPMTVYQTASGIAATATGTAGVASLTDTVLTSEKGDNAGFGLGLIQNLPGIGVASAFYVPNRTNAATAVQSDTANAAVAGGQRNSHYSVGFRLNQMIKNFDAHIGYNEEATNTPTQAGVTSAISHLTFGAKYTFNNIVVAAERTEQQYNSTGSDRTIDGLGLGYVVNKDLTVAYNIYRAKDSAPTTAAKEKTHGITIGQSLGPVGLTVTAAKVDNAGGTASQDGKAVHVQLGVAF